MDFLPILISAGSIILAPVITFMVNSAPQWFNNVAEKASVSHHRIQKENIEEKLDRNFEGIKGQDNVLAEIKDRTSAWFESRKNPDENSGALVLHFAGPSGTGKSHTTMAMTAALVGKKANPYVISCASVDMHSSKTIAEQLFADTKSAYGRTQVVHHTPLVVQLENNPKTVVRIDEFDKLTQKDNSLEAVLWDAADEGVIRVGGKTIACHDCVFILTSNASPESVGLGKDPAVDETKSLNKVNLQQAFLNRISTIYFNDFSAEVYAQIFADRLKVAKDYYSKKFKISVHISQEDINTIARELENLKTGGARNVKSYVDKLYVALANYRKENSITESSKKLPSREITVAYNTVTKKFFVKS